MQTPNITSAKTADELLTALATVNPDYREDVLAIRTVKILREAADLCGVDSDGMSKRQAIRAIINNF